MIDSTYDASDQATVDNQAKESARRDKEDAETIRVWMSHPKGRELLYRIVYEICHMGQTFVAVDHQGHSDTHRTYLDLGERNIGAWLDEQLRKQPKLYMEMLQEQEIEREVRSARLAKQNAKADD